jgi:hypothetical protein
LQHKQATFRLVLTLAHVGREKLLLERLGLGFMSALFCGQVAQELADCRIL